MATGKPFMESVLKAIEKEIVSELKSRAEALRAQAHKDLDGEIDKIIATAGINLSKFIEVQSYNERLVITLVKKDENKQGD